MSEHIVVIGGGTVGSAIAYGLAGRGAQVELLDGGDRDLRAAVANFGLVWCQGKGLDLAEYQRLTHRSVDAWPDFVADLTTTTGRDLQYERNGGLALCLGEAEFEKQRLRLMRLHNQLGGDPPDAEMLDRAALARLLPGVTFGPDVTGASYGRKDGHVNPLRLLTALQDGIVRRGGSIRPDTRVDAVVPRADGGFTLSVPGSRIDADKIVIAAGLGSRQLAAAVGLDIPLRPQRGQILVTERITPFLPLPCSGLRQTREGTVMMGATHEEAGEDRSTTVEAAAALSAKAIRRVPALAAATLVRQWSGLRILTPDGFPIYCQSPAHPNAFVALCHSGVTLAAAHATQLADAILAGHLASQFDAFHPRRFDVPNAA